MTFLLSSFSQIEEVKETYQSKDGLSKMVVFAEEGKNSPIGDALFLINKHFNLSKSDELKLKTTIIDDNGIKHDRYIRYYLGIIVENSEIIVHSRKGSILSING
jgi:Zn-dependent metalloprotease